MLRIKCLANFYVWALLNTFFFIIIKLNLSLNIFQTLFSGSADPFKLILYVNYIFLSLTAKRLKIYVNSF